MASYMPSSGSEKIFKAASRPMADSGWRMADGLASKTSWPLRWNSAPSSRARSSMPGVPASWMMCSIERVEGPESRVEGEAWRGESVADGGGLIAEGEAGSGELGAGSATWSRTLAMQRRNQSSWL